MTIRRNTALFASLLIAITITGTATRSVTIAWADARKEDVKFPAVGLALKLPYKYKVWGVKDGGEGEDAIWCHIEDDKAVWMGLTYHHVKPLEEGGMPVGINPGVFNGVSANIAPQTAMLKTIGSEDCIVTVDGKAETLLSVEVSVREDTPARVERQKFVFQNLPRRATVDLGPNAGVLYYFWLKGEEMKKNSTTCEVGAEGDYFETDPAKNEPVKVHFKSALTSAVWKDSYLVVVLSTITAEEFYAREKKGLIDAQKVMDGIRKGLIPILEREDDDAISSLLEEVTPPFLQ